MAKKPPPQFGHTPFRDLRPPPPRAPAPAAAAPPPPPKPPAPKKNEPALAAEDQRLFEQAMRGVRPLGDTARRQRALLTDERPSVDREARRRVAAREQALAEAELADLVEESSPFAIDEVGETLSAVAPGIDRRLLRRLRAGDYPVEAEIDLHRRTRAQAQGELERFVADARAAGKRCLLVIHGRGLGSGPEGPVLKNAVRDWLTTGRLRRLVLALCSAPADRGGEGAVLVLLRRQPR